MLNLIQNRLNYSIRQNKPCILYLSVKNGKLNVLIHFQLPSAICHSYFQCNLSCLSAEHDSLKMEGNRGESAREMGDRVPSPLSCMLCAGLLGDKYKDTALISI